MILGFSFAKDNLYYACLDGNKQNPSLQEKGRLDTISTSNVPKMMDWFHTSFLDLIVRTKPTAIAARHTLGLKKDQQTYFLFPLGILGYVSFTQQLPLTLWSSSQFGPSRFGLPKGTDIYELCDAKFGENPPYWNDSQKHAILASWFSLL